MLSIETREDVTNMAESKYKFERLTPTDDVDLAVYEEAIDYVLKILYLIFDYPHKHYTFKYFEV